MGFANGVRLILKCITTVSYAANINGRRGRTFQPAKRLRQCDPFSPFLFLICSKGLSLLIRLAMGEGLIKGAKASKSGPKISHLLFANDCILFSEATIRGAIILKGILKDYESCSGQCVTLINQLSSIARIQQKIKKKKKKSRHC